MESFDPELKTYFSKIKEEIKLEHIEYIKSHPELRDILNDFISSLLLDKPENIYTYAKEYFSFFNVDKKKEQSRLLIICGPSGVGKGTILAKLLEKNPNTFEFSVSWTTRKQRPKEINGVNYYFKTREDFEEEIKKNGFIEYMDVHGNYYGTHKSHVQSIFGRGKICILEIDIKGAERIYEKYPSANFIFFNVRDLNTLRERIMGRGTETQEELEKRLKTAVFECENFSKMGIFTEIFNENVETCYSEFLELLRKRFSDIKFT